MGDNGLPVGWCLGRVDSVAEVVGGSTPSRAHPEFFGGDIPWVTPTDITALRGRFLTDSQEKVTQAGFKAGGLRLLPARTVLLTSRATIGATAIADVPVTTNQGFQSLIAREGTDPLWLYYAINGRKSELDSLASGSTFREFSRDNLRAMRLVIPPAPEQARIATILDSIDAAIEKTEAVIEAAERLRKALVQELLARGMPGWHTEWREVPGVGTIPACWEVVRLGEVLVSTEYGINAPLSDEKGEVAVLRMGNLSGGSILWSSLKWTSSADEKLLIKEGDILFNRTNSLDLVGKVSLVTELPVKSTFASYLVRLNPDLGRANPRWLNAYLNADDAQARIQSLATKGASQANVNPTSLGTVRVELPRTREQEAIADFLGVVAGVVLRSRRTVEALRNLKSATARTLLSGDTETLVYEGASN